METVISTDGTRIAYDKTGHGPALILVDGAFCYRENGTTPRLVPLLSDHFTVFSYDRRGRGESTNTRPYSIDQETEDLKALAEATNETPYILGISSGAALVLHSIRNGLKVKRIALYEPPYVVINKDDKAPPKEAIGVLEDLSEHGKRSEAVKYFMAKVMGMPSFIIFMFKLFDKQGWKKNESVAHTLSYDVALMGNYSVPKKMTNVISVPTLVLGGEKSPKNLVNAVKATGLQIPLSETWFLKGQGHNVSMNVLAPVLIEFFS